MSSTVPTVRPPVRPTWVIITVLIIADIVSSVESAMMLVALPRLMEAFESNAADVSWVITAFMLVGAVSAAICGRLGDIYGRRRVLVVLLLISVVGSIVSIATGNLVGVVIGRAIQGVAGGILPLCFGLAREHLAPKRVPVAIALIAGTAMLAAAIGGLISGLVVDNLDWHYLFVVAGVIAIVSAVVCMVLPRSTVIARVERIDYVGAVLLAAAIALVLLGVTRSATWTWTDPRTIGCVVGGLVALAVWTWWELRHDSPMINIRAFLQRKLGLTLLAMIVLATGVMGGATVVFPLLAVTSTDAPVGLGLSATQAGLIGFGTTILAFAVAPISGRIAARSGARTALLVGSALGVLASIAIALLHPTVPGLIAANASFLIAMSFIATSLPNLVVEEVPAENTSEMTGMITVARTAFTGVGTAVVTLLLSTSVVPGTRYSTLAAFNGVFVFIGACCLTGLVLALLIRPTRPLAAVPAPADAVAPARIES